jgi:RNA polymerase sigma-70 factor (ECF subfamily)
MTEENDEALIRQLARGESGALRVLVRRHESPVRSFLSRRLASPEDAEEATQDVFMKLSRGARTFNGTAAFRPWLYAIARNVLRDRLRKKAPPRTVPLSSDPTEGIEVHRRDSSREEVREALAALPRRYRAALSLKYLAGMSYREGAEELGLSERGFETRLARARVLFRQALARVRGDADDL